MLEIRWHSRAGQGAVTGAKGLADVDPSLVDMFLRNMPEMLAIRATYPD